MWLNRILAEWNQESGSTYIDDILVVAQLDVVAYLIVVDLGKEGHIVETLLLHNVYPFCFLGLLLYYCNG